MTINKNLYLKDGDAFMDFSLSTDRSLVRVVSGTPERHSSLCLKEKSVKKLRDFLNKYLEEED